MTYDDFISRFDKRVKNQTGILVCCPAHEDRTPSLQVTNGQNGKILLYCHAGCKTESVLESLGLTTKDLFPETPIKHFVVKSAPVMPTTTQKPVIEAIYPYHDALGGEVYQAIRMKPKSFRQRHRNLDGNWVWNMESVERVLYRLPEVLKSQQVIVLEGEKDVNNMVELGFQATCNVGGAGKWMDGYTESLSGKDVVICGDNDEPGRKHVKMVFDSICGSAKSVKIIKLPDSVKDASDYIATFNERTQAKAAFDDLISKAVPFFKGVELPIYTMAELESGYKEYVKALAENTFSLSKWLPGFRFLRPLVVGELVFVLGNTGTGKTALLSDIARAALPLPTILFELELPPELLFERLMAAVTKFPCRDVEDGYLNGGTLEDELNRKFKNLYICTQSKLSLADLERIIIKSELKIGQRPKVICVDYIQLIGAEGANRREKTSDVAEGLKVLAKTTKTIIIVTSQVRRPDPDDPEVGLHDGKESGSIEASCGVLIGAWRDQKETNLLHLKVLKSTKGGAGLHIKCNYDGARMSITEMNTAEPETRQQHKN